METVIPESMGQVRRTTTPIQWIWHDWPSGKGYKGRKSLGRQGMYVYVAYEFIGTCLWHIVVIVDCVKGSMSEAN